MPAPMPSVTLVAYSTHQVKSRAALLQALFCPVLSFALDPLPNSLPRP